jgi:hypothetical protein
MRNTCRDAVAESFALSQVGVSAKRTAVLALRVGKLNWLLRSLTLATIDCGGLVSNLKSAV